jgi:hypothetical protein
MVVYGLGSFAVGYARRHEFVGVFLLEQVDRAVQKYHARTGRSFFSSFEFKFNHHCCCALESPSWFMMKLATSFALKKLNEMEEDKS